MKFVTWTLGILIGILVLLAVLQTVASERVEVVQLHTLDADGETVTTRLWIVDDEQKQYLRADGGSAWLARLKANGTFTLTRSDVTKRYGFVIRDDRVNRINRLMADKYTWGDEFFAVMLGGREGAIPVELQPLGDS